MIYHRKRKGRSLHNRGCDQSLIRKYILMNGNGCGSWVFGTDIFFGATCWLVAPKKISQDFQKNPLVTRLFRTFLYSFLPSSFAIGGISCLFNCVQKKIPVRIDVFPIFKTRVAGFKSGNLFTKIIDFLEIILSIRYNNV